MKFIVLVLLFVVVAFGQQCTQDAVVVGVAKSQRLGSGRFLMVKCFSVTSFTSACGHELRVGYYSTLTNSLIWSTVTQNGVVQAAGHYNVDWFVTIASTSTANECVTGVSAAFIGVPSVPQDCSAVPTNRTTVVISTNDAAPPGVYRTYELGYGLQASFHCLNLYSSHLDPTIAQACNSNLRWGLELVYGPSCLYGTLGNVCCGIGEDEATCTANAASDCAWSSEAKSCYPIQGVVDVTELVAGVTPQSPMSFIAQSQVVAGTHAKTTTAVRWALRYRHDNTGMCSQSVTLTAVAYTSEGVCEESAMVECATAAADCVSLSSRDTSKTKFCQCLRLQERCYRQASCTRNSHYNAILQDCVESGCGNFCSWGTYSQPLSVMILAVALLIHVMLFA